ncbi:maleylpyruvate isomerase family mycothiol-dependent enzyme [Georgenia sp. H159]|uniref:maleylpyruvate isomerase family mycothiol-dependent enzyme n=1 Tax=Georgenia sp. H159 TaxID=3076115 RepID=UPI002D77D2D1|nr:maleylpyruvate isomerase family mycothiol-dependent enzyme [Georgenia sp. H159]
MPGLQVKSPAALMAHTRAQRTAMAQLLTDLTETQWQSPSLCRGWTVGHVAAHLTMPFRVTATRLGRELLRARCTVDRALDRIAREDLAELGREGVLASLWANIDHAWTPPGGGPVGSLAHDVIHGLDITDALGLPPVSPPERVAVVVEESRDRLARFGVDLAGYRLEASDVDVTVGQGGTRCLLPAAQILLVCTGRRSVAEAVARARHESV